MPKRCGNCGGSVVPQPSTHIEMYKGVPLTLPDDLLIPTCTKCGEQFINHTIAKRMTEVLEQGHQEVLYDRFIDALDRLRDYVSLAAIERLLGYSQGYLSKLKQERRNLTKSTVLQLMQLAVDPRKRLDELNDFFDAPGGEHDKRQSQRP